MRSVSSSFQAAVLRSHTRAVAIQSLTVRSDGSFDVAEEIAADELGTVLDGVIGMDRTRTVVRDASLTFAWSTRLTVAQRQALALNRWLRVQDGIWISGAVEWVTLGTFLTNRWQLDVDIRDGVLSLQGADRLSIALIGKFRAPWTVAAGTRVEDAIYDIAVDQGMGTAAEIYDLDDGGAVVSVTTTFDYLTERLVAMKQLAEDHGLVLDADAMGRLRLRVGPTSTTLPAASFTFEPGTQAIHEGVVKDVSSDRLFNASVVRGESALHKTVIIAEERDLNPESPAYNPLPPAVGPIGDRPYTYSSSLIGTEEQAQTVAARNLLENALVEEAFRLKSIVHPALEPGDVVRITEPDVDDTDDDFLLDTLVIPLGAPDSMTITTKRTRSFL